MDMKTTLLNTRKSRGLLRPEERKEAICRLGKFKLTLFILMLINLFVCNNALAQIVQRGSATSATSTNTTLTINKPTGVVEGDVMLANISQTDDNDALTSNASSSGWTLIAGADLDANTNPQRRGTLLYKIATASEGSNYVFSLDGNATGNIGAIIAFSGVDIAGGFNAVGGVGGPFDVDPGSITVSNGSTINATSITTATADALVIMFGQVGGDDSAYGTWNAASIGNMTELYDQRTTSGEDASVGAASILKITAGASGAGTVGINPSERNGGIMIALRRFTGSTSTGTITSPICAGNAISVPYTITGTYASGNIFTAELSNASGSFASPVAIGTANSTVAGTISATIPGGQAAGSGYRIRVTSSLPSAPTANQNTSNITITAPATAVAGPAFSACQTASSINLGTGASASNNAGTLWTTTGSGSIANATSVGAATYAPGIGETGNVTFTLTATGNGSCANASSNKTLTLVAPPTASAGGSATICSDATSVVSGASSSNGTILWTENGAGSITAGATTLTPTYTAAAADGGNTVTLTMTVTNVSCGSVQATYAINVIGAATASAGTPITMCTNAGATNITMGATATNNTDITWTSNGTGTIANANSLTLATYTPGVGETGNVTLTLTATGNTPCGTSASNKVLTINPIPVATGVTICAGQSGSLSSSYVCASTAPISSGVQFAGAGATSGSGTAWANTGNIFSDNATYATATGQGITSQNLNATNFNFGLPVNATIVGIQASIARFRSGTALGGNIQDTSLRILKGGVQVGTNNGATATNWPDSEAVANYGSPTDLWGAGLTAADVNASNFGISLVIDISAAFGNRIANVEYINMSVTYTLPGSLDWYTVSSGGSLIGSGSPFNPVGVAGSGLADTNTPGTTTFYVECATVAGCRTPVNFLINALPTVSFSGLDASYCGTTAAILLTGNQAPAGSFTGAGITDNGNGTATFNPANAAVGINAIVYSYTDGNTCVNTDSQNVTIIAPTTYYADADGDGFGDINVTELSCDGPSLGFVADNTDCDDNLLLYTDVDGDGFGSDTFVNCGGVSNTLDCDDNQIQYLDNDGDGFGSSTQVACGVTNNTDCDDNDITKNTTFQFYVDADADGYGTGSLVSVCAVDAVTPPANYSINNTDCNDQDVLVYQNGSLFVDADNDGYNDGTSAIVCYGAIVPSGYALNDIGLDCNDSVASINPGATEILYNGIDDNCDSNLDEGNLLTTSLLTSVCNTTLTSIGSIVGITTVAGHPITGYRIRATNGAEVQIIERGVPNFTMVLFPSYTYATTYTIDIELQRAGIWLGYYGATCQVSTPAILAEGGASSVSPSQCGITLPKINTLIATTSIQGVTGYRFRVTNLTDPLGPQSVQVIDRALNWFTLPMLARSNYGTLYQIEVAVKTTGNFGGFGSPCDVSSPLAPSLINCEATIATSNSLVAATSVTGVTQYRFQITRQSDSASATIDRSVNYFTFSMVPAIIYTPSALYTVRVAVMTSGTWSPLGDACEITSPAGAAKPATEMTNELAVEFKAVASPNPFVSDFGIDVITSSQDNVSVKVYDMLGRLVESQEVKVSDLNTTKVGSRYPAGVYNVIVSQSGIVKTLRVIKR